MGGNLFGIIHDLHKFLCKYWKSKKNKRKKRAGKVYMQIITERLWQTPKGPGLHSWAFWCKLVSVSRWFWSWGIKFTLTFICSVFLHHTTKPTFLVKAKAKVKAITMLKVEWKSSSISEPATTTSDKENVGNTSKDVQNKWYSVMYIIMLYK